MKLRILYVCGPRDRPPYASKSHWAMAPKILHHHAAGYMYLKKSHVYICINLMI